MTETTETTTKIIKFESIPTPEEFFNRVKELNEVSKVKQICDALLEVMSEKYTVATKSRNLSAYKKPFYKYTHTNPELNESVNVKKEGSKTQHIAANLLTLSKEEKEELEKKRNERDIKRAGFNSEGEIRDIEKPAIDITKVINKSIECLNSIDPYTIGAGIINLTGLRANEQNMPTREYPNWETIIERDMVVLDEYLIGFKGISKKKKENDSQAYFARTTLAPAQMIVDAQKRFWNNKTVQEIGHDYETYRKGFLDTFYNRYLELFGNTLSTVEAYEDDGTLLEGNGSPHKGRAFYACALRAILKSKKYGNDACNKYIQQCLAHEEVGITIKYLGRYDDKEFINPIEINALTNIKKKNTLPIILNSIIFTLLKNNNSKNIRVVV